MRSRTAANDAFKRPMRLTHCVCDSPLMLECSSESAKPLSSSSSSSLLDEEDDDDDESSSSSVDEERLLDDDELEDDDESDDMLILPYEANLSVVDVSSSSSRFHVSVVPPLSSSHATSRV